MHDTGDMEAYVKEGFAALEVTLNFEADADLSTYRKGPPLTLKELRALPDNSPVYVTYKEYGEDRYRINGAMRAKLDAGQNSWFLDDGSSFAADFTVGPTQTEDAQCYECPCGQGDFYLFHAVPKKTAGQPKPKK